jgi:XTP/dITP diphosphohydrolase
LLQVLFHARIAEDAPENAFSIDDVADSLIRKLVHRVPAVLAGEEISLEDQLAQWEERKAHERSIRGVRSVVDDVPTGQPSLALAQKVIERVTAAGLPADLVPASVTSVSVAAHVDTENALRSSVLEFMDTVRTVEIAIAAGRRGDDAPGALDVSNLGVIAEEEWRAHWPAEPDEAQEVDGAEEAEEPDEAQAAVEDVQSAAREPAGSDTEHETAGRPVPVPADASPGGNEDKGDDDESRDQEVVVESL